jgi:hypothetical protein
VAAANWIGDGATGMIGDGSTAVGKSKRNVSPSAGIATVGSVEKEGLGSADGLLLAGDPSFGALHARPLEPTEGAALDCITGSGSPG